MAIIKDNKRGTYYISYKEKTADGWKTVNIRNNDWRCTGDLKVTLRWMKSIEQSEIEEDKKKRCPKSDESDASHPSIGNICDSFIESLEVSGMRKGTVYRYELDLRNYLCKALGRESRACDALTVNGMDKVRKLMSDSGLSTDTMNSKLASMRNLLKFAKSRKFLPREQADDCLDSLTGIRDNGAKAREEPNFFSNGDEDVMRFFATFSEADGEWLLPMHVLFYGAFRIGEFLGITTDCILPESDGIKICKQVLPSGELEYATKTGRDRIVRLPHKIMDDLVSYVKESCLNEGAFLFSKNGRKPYSRMTVRRIVDKHLEMAGLRHITLHGLRHSMATRMFDRGYDVREVQEQLGHSSMETTMEFYIHYTNSKRKKDLDDLL